MSVKRSLKSVALEIASGRGTPESVSQTVLAKMGIVFDPPNRANYPDGKKAAFCVSLDFDHLTKSLEPGSSRWYPKRVNELLSKNRVGTKDMVAASEKYSIPMTWAICGRTAEEDPEAYDNIRRSKVAQEIGVHTYSHADVASCSEEELWDEVQKCLNILNLPEHPKTFIFPWNRTGHFETLSKMGFVTYRDQKRVVGAPREHLGLLNIPPTYYVDTKSYGAESLIKKYLDLCISRNCVFHLWMHPWSVVLDESGRFVKETIEPVFSYAAEKRNEGLLAICTMGDLASFWRKSIDAISSTS